ncbi:MAG: hypothetical protein VXY03_05620 [Bacteroidota bacterium]|nr:hypothetical protein [Bacteroidota bacterium]
MNTFNITPLQSTPAVFFMALFLAVSGQIFGQAVSLTPSPTGPDDLVTLTIDVSQSQENGLKTVLEANPDLPVYIWTWSPSGPVAGNGDWNNSNDAMQLSWQGGLVYSLQFVPSEFYSDVSSLFSNGISCLAKLKDGNPYPGFEDFGEAKTEDFNIGVLPKLCEDQMCIFPETRRKDDFVSITYNSNIDSVLTDIENDEVYLQIAGRGTDGQFYTLVPDDQVTSTPELKMTPVPGKPGFYRWTLLPDDFFADILPEGLELLTMTCYPLKANFTYPPDVTPWDGIYYITSVPLLDCE